MTKQTDALRHVAQWTRHLPPFWPVIVLAAAPLGVFEFVLPLFGASLGASTTTIGWLFSVFSFTALALRPLVGALLDLGRQGARHRWLPSPVGLLTWGLIAYAASMALFAVATSVTMLVAARLVQGVASTVTWLTINVVLADRSDPTERARAFGMLTSLSVVGNGLGATWTVAIVALFDATTRTQITALMPTITAASGLPFDRFVFPTPAFDTVTTLHIVFWGYVGCMLLALVVLPRRRRETGDERWTTSETSEQAPIWQIMSRVSPLTPLLVASFLRSGGYALTLPVLTVYLNDRFGAGLVGVGLAFILPGVVYAIAPGPLGRLADRIGHQRAAVMGLLASVATYVLLPLLPSLVLLVPLWAFEALCFCLAGPALTALLTDRAPAGLRGRAFALYTLVGGLGAALTPALGGWMYDQFGAAWPFWGNGLLVAVSALCIAWPAVPANTHAPTP